MGLNTIPSGILVSARTVHSSQQKETQKPHGTTMDDSHPVLVSSVTPWVK